MGYQIAAAKFAVFFALMFLMLLISETLGILCAGFHRTELVGLIILSIFYLPLLMFTGFIQVPYPNPTHALPGLDRMSEHSSAAAQVRACMAPAADAE